MVSINITHKIYANDVGGPNILYLMKDGITLDGIQVFDNIINDNIDYIFYIDKEDIRIILYDRSIQALIFLLMKGINVKTTEEKLIADVDLELRKFLQKSILF